MDKNGPVYAAATAGAVSAPRLVTITSPDPSDPRLPSPAITEGNVLDLSRFTGDAHATMNPWILITEGQRVWLWITHDGGTIDVLTGHAVTAADIAFGLSIAVSRDTLAAIGAGKELSIHAAVNYEGGSIKPADTFPARTYRMANGSGGMGTETVENFRGVGSLSLTPGQIILFPDTRLTMELHAGRGTIDEKNPQLKLIPTYSVSFIPEKPVLYIAFSYLSAAEVYGRPDAKYFNEKNISMGEVKLAQELAFVPLEGQRIARVVVNGTQQMGVAPMTITGIRSAY